MEGTARFLDCAGGARGLSRCSMKLQAEEMGWEEEG